MRAPIDRMMWHTRLFAAALVVTALLYEGSLIGGFNRLTYDSLRYLAGAESIIQTGYYFDISGEPQRVWPPGTSLILAGMMSITELDYDRSTQIMGFLSTVVAAFSLFMILQQVIDRQWLVLMALASFILNIWFLLLQQKLLSDPMALALLLISMSCAINSCVKKGSDWLLWFIFSCLILSVAIIFRFAMISAIPVLCAIGIWSSISKMSYRSIIFIPLLAPLPLLICFALLGVPILEERVSGVRSLDLRDDLQALFTVSDQFVPTKIFPEFVAIPGYLLFIIILPTYMAILKNGIKKRAAIFVSIGFIFSYGVFIIVSQSIADPSFSTGQRILLPLIPFSIISLTVATEMILGVENKMFRFLSILLLCFLNAPTARTVRTVVLDKVPGYTIDPVRCVARDQLVHHIRSAVGDEISSVVLSNSQGETWYALRSKVLLLSEKNLQSAPIDSIIIFVKPELICEDVENYGGINESSISDRDDIIIIKENEYLILMSKVHPRKDGL